MAALRGDIRFRYLKQFCPTKVIMVRDTPPYGHALTYQIALTYLERQKVMVRTSFAEKKQKKRKRKNKSD
jgi:hypothetical protein